MTKASEPPQSERPTVERLRAELARLPLDDALRDTVAEGLARCDDAEMLTLADDLRFALDALPDAVGRLADDGDSPKAPRSESLAPDEGQSTEDGDLNAGAPHEDNRRGSGNLEEAQVQLLINGLEQVQGQIRGVLEMVQEPTLCIEILQQLATAEAALNRVSRAVLEYHVETCVPSGANAKNARRELQSRQGRDATDETRELIRRFEDR